MKRTIIIAVAILAAISAGMASIIINMKKHEVIQ